ncbi:MAG TPA: MFS transporter [Methylomirabilota bacterium]|nr:MFS transporter [Methylomirabilota bacterium]
MDAWLAILCASRAFNMLVFQTYAAALPVVWTAWGMSAVQAGSISTGFQAGYAVSLLGFSALADRIGARRVFLWSGVLSAVAALGFALFARSYASGLLLYTLVGLSQGGTYTTAIMLIADRYPPARRGGAVGWLLAFSSLGYAMSLLVSGLALRLGGYPLAFVLTGVGPAIGIAMAWVPLRVTPDRVHARAAGRRFGGEVLRNRSAMRLILGYTFHSWELLGMWAWTPAFVAAAMGAAGATVLRAAELGAFMSAAFHLTGLVASFSMGRLSDRLGRRVVLVAMAATATACSFTFGWLIGWPLALIFAVGAVYAFTALGDSPVLSTAVTEAVSPAYLGSALALRSLLGFGAGAIAPLAFGAVLKATNPATTTPMLWGWAFASLGLGGLVATICAWGLPRERGVLAREVTSYSREARS